MNEHLLVGFGLGPIQAGLFAAEAFKSGRFKRIVIAEIDQRLVNAIRANHGRYAVNVASDTGVTKQYIEGVDVYNPEVQADRQQLIEALSHATEIVTSLPSVNFYDSGADSVVSLIARGLSNSSRPAVLVYTAENNNHAAEILQQKLRPHLTVFGGQVQFLNTVIGKMSQVVTDEAAISEKALAPIAQGFPRAFLVEEFNRILVTQCVLSGFRPGIDVFIEKENLLPFEEAKLYRSEERRVG